MSVLNAHVAHVPTYLVVLVLSYLCHWLFTDYVHTAARFIPNFKWGSGIRATLDLGDTVAAASGAHRAGIESGVDIESVMTRG